MTLDQFITFIKGIKYKPNFRLKVEGDYFMAEKGKPFKSQLDPELTEARIEDFQFYEQMTLDQFRLRFEMDVQDAYDPKPDRLFTLIKEVRLSPKEIETLEEPMWCRIIYNHILNMEKHEAGEFFQVNGKRPFNPHHRLAS